MKTVLTVNRFSQSWQAQLAQDAADRSLPFVLTGVVTEWPAFSTWSLDHLAQRIGSRPVTVGVSQDKVFHYGSEEHPPVRTQEMTFDQAMHRIANRDRASNEHLYVMEQKSPAGHSLADVYPELKNDFSIPGVIGSENLRQTNLWIGTSGNVTPLHYDAANNFLAQVVGRKRVHLFPPSQSHLLYPNGTRQTANNTSRVSLLKPDYDKHPRFRDAVAHECVLQPGEMLHIPPYWWHHVESLDTAISINFWWKQRLAQCFNAMGIQSIYHHHDRGELAHAHGVVDLSEFRDLAHAGEYCLDHGLRCIAVLFGKAEFERRRALADLAGPPITRWQDLIRKAEHGDDEQLDNDQVMSFLKHLMNPRTTS
jgi:hypothetical protein